MNIRTNSEVRNESDLQSLVTSIILRKQKPYLPKEVHDLVNYYLKDSKFYNNHGLIRKYVNETIDVFIRNNEIKCWGGTLYPTDIYGETTQAFRDAVSKGINGIKNPNYWHPKKKLLHGEYY